RNVAVDRAFAADVDAVAALDITGHFAHDHNFAGLDAGVNLAVAADGHAALGHGDLALDAAINVESFRPADFALDDQSAADGGLIDGRGDGFDRVVGVGVGSRGTGLRVIEAVRRLKHATFLGPARRSPVCACCS